MTVVEPKRPASGAPGTPATAVSVAGNPGSGPASERRGWAAQGTHLIGQLLNLCGEGAQLRFHTVEAHAIGSAAEATVGGGRRRTAASAASRERFERADHNLHIDELFFELLDALLERGVFGRRRRFRFWRSLLSCRLRQLHGCARRLGRHGADGQSDTADAAEKRY